ncbi:MAG: hypothetical protein RR764_10315, partial [Oscillospiraceae bacterium]
LGAIPILRVTTPTFDKEPGDITDIFDKEQKMARCSCIEHLAAFLFYGWLPQNLTKSLPILRVATPTFDKEPSYFTGGYPNI